jgi:ABC-2 type transport system ATP-binding protein
MSELSIEAHGLEKTYRKSVRALDGLSFEARAGTIFALLGPNGAGKSTTVKILTTLSRPDRGSARVGGIDVLAPRSGKAQDRNRQPAASRNPDSHRS